MEKIRPRQTLHSDFALEWDSDFEGSLAASRVTEGIVIMKYSVVPYFLYALAKRIGNFDFLDAKAREQILSCEMVSFADQSYDYLAHIADMRADFYKSVWTGSYISKEDGKGKTIDAERLKELRDADHLSELMDILKKHGVNPEDVEYVGWASGSIEYVQPVHVLSSGQDTIISQHFNAMNVLRTNPNETRDIIRDIIGSYGVVVSGALRSLLER